MPGKLSPPSPPEQSDTPPILRTLRQDAWKKFVQQGFTTLNKETYKHTPIAAAFAKYITHPSPIGSRSQDTQLHTVNYLNIDAHHIVVLDGKLSQQYSDYDDTVGAINILTFQEAYLQGNQAFLNHFSTYTLAQREAFITLNTAMFSQGLLIHVSDYTTVHKPIIVYHCNTEHANATPLYLRLLVVVGKHSQACLITDSQTTSPVNAVTETTLQEGAQLDAYTLQTTDIAYDHPQVHTSYYQQATQSTLNNYTLSWSGRMLRNNLTCTLDAPYSHANLYGLYCLQGQQHVDNTTQIIHQQPHTHSNELYKGILCDHATGVFQGNIRVPAPAQHTRASQTNSNLLCSDHATLYTRPHLDIWADDVKCTHGATTGTLDEAQLFYLQTRGLTHKTATRLLQHAFVKEVLDHIPLPALKAHLYNQLKTRSFI